MRRRMTAAAAIALFGGVYLAAGYINPYDGRISLSELVLQLSGSRGSLPLGFSMQELISLAMRMIPEFILEMYFGTEVYRHFCTASVYVFSRYPGRLRWYFREILWLWLQILTFQAVQMAAVILVSVWKEQVMFDAAGVILVIYHCLLRAAWAFCMALIVNLLSIFWESGFAFMAVMGGQALLTAQLGVVEKLETVFSEETGKLFLQWNPMARQVLGWQSGGPQALKTAYRPPDFGLDLNTSLLIHIFLCTAALLAGAVLVKEYELVASTVEEGEGTV